MVSSIGFCCDSDASRHTLLSPSSALPLSNHTDTSNPRESWKSGRGIQPAGRCPEGLVKGDTGPRGSGGSRQDLAWKVGAQGLQMELWCPVGTAAFLTTLAHTAIPQASPTGRTPPLLRLNSQHPLLPATDFLSVLKTSPRKCCSALCPEVSPHKPLKVTTFRPSVTSPANPSGMPELIWLLVMN